MPAIEQPSPSPSPSASPRSTSPFDSATPHAPRAGLGLDVARLVRTRTRVTCTCTCTCTIRCDAEERCVGGSTWFGFEGLGADAACARDSRELEHVHEHEHVYVHVYVSRVRARRSLVGSPSPRSASPFDWATGDRNAPDRSRARAPHAPRAGLGLEVLFGFEGLGALGFGAESLIRGSRAGAS